MATARAGRSVLYRRHGQPSLMGELSQIAPLLRPTPHPPCRSPRCLQRCRNFSSSGTWREEQKQRHQESFGSRLRSALKKTKIEWYPIPVGLGIGFLGLVQFLRVRQREEERRMEEEEGRELMRGKRPPKRKIRPTEGGWQVKVMSTLPLKALSRLWGRFNELDIPYYLRVPGFKLYSKIFGVNLDEVGELDLHAYPNLSAFFYRTLKPGVRPLDPNLLAVLSPADGRVLQFGTIERGEVEQVKGMTYSLEALLGQSTPPTTPNPNSPKNIFGEPDKTNIRQSPASYDDSEVQKSDEEFANLNGISYTLPDLLSGDLSAPQQHSEAMDASTTPKSSSEAEVRADLTLGEPSSSWFLPSKAKSPSALYYVVIYLAPGDYHRFHSPVSWVVERRRHFAGELYSVSPYLQKRLPGLFTLNERVVLIGRWRWGFFSFTPVGATNVGSVKINFDRELRTNSLLTDTAADRAAAEAAERGERYSGYSEATYEAASKVLRGHALRRGEEMGGFQLGSSIVLVFEAPKGNRGSLDEDWKGGKAEGGWNWAIEKGQRVKYGEKIGWVEEV
jgi:phosphatidylserine decarboxylase